MSQLEVTVPTSKKNDLAISGFVNCDRFTSLNIFATSDEARWKAICEKKPPLLFTSDFALLLLLH